MLARSLSSRPIVAAAVLLLATVFCAPDCVNGQTDSPAVQINSVQLGFSGNVILGRWNPVQIDITGANDQHKIHLQTLDGDAVPLRSLAAIVNGVGLIRIGRATGLQVEVTDSGDKILATRRFSLDELRESHSFLPGTTRMAVVLGVESDDQMDLLEMNKGIADLYVRLSDFRQLPSQAMAYQCVHTLLVAPVSVPENWLQPVQCQAIEKWVRSGGRVLITGGPHYEKYFGESALAAIAVGPFSEFQEIKNASPIELMVTSGQPLFDNNEQSLQLVTTNLPDSAFVETQVGNQPLVVRWNVGFGDLTLIGIDFTADPLAGWENRRALLTVIMAENSTPEDSSLVQTGRVSHIGFTDIAGQMRAGLEQFRNVPVITFTLVALLVVLFILFIGPADYFFLKKVTGRMEFTWITFTLLCAAFGALAWYLSSVMKSSEIQINQLEIVDIDSQTGQLQANLWAHIYSPTTASYDLSLDRQSKLFGELDERWLTWQGLPGTGLGSMSSRSDLGLYRRQYECQMNDNGCEIKQVPLQNASTKTLTGFWTGQLEKPVLSLLRKGSSNDALFGTVTNPLDVPLYGCVVLYGDWVYILEDRPLDPGDTIVVEDDLREKTISGFFTRLGKQGQDDVNTAWDPTSLSLPRIVKMMSFFDVIGGQTYTRLTNDFHPTLDLSHQLAKGNAVLIGEFQRTSASLVVDGKPADQTADKYDKRLTLVRIVLPVAKPEN